MSSRVYRWLIVAVTLMPGATSLYAQDMPDEPNESRQLESVAEKRDAEPDDDSHEQDLENWKAHPLDLNHASDDELYTLQQLTALQVENFILYRKLLGNLLSVHELQAVPGWDLQTIREVLPYIRVGKQETLYSALRERWKGGDASFLLRSGRVLEKSAGYEKPAIPGGAALYQGWQTGNAVFRFT